MSSRVVKDGTAPAQPMTWRAIGTPVTEAYRLFPEIPDQDQTQPDSGRSRIQELEDRVKQLEREVEQRSQAAFQQGVHQGDSGARQQLSGQAEAMLLKLARTIEEISGVRQRYRREAEEDVVKLALAIARRIIHRELTIDPDALLGLVKAALEKIDAREVHRIRVHPENAPILQQHLERMGLPRRLEVAADPSLERGAAVFETAHGSLDASAETQLAEIERGFTDLVRHST